MTGHEGGQGGGASPGDLKLSGVTLGAKEKEGGDRVENQEAGAEPLHTLYINPSGKCVDAGRSVSKRIKAQCPSIWLEKG